MNGPTLKHGIQEMAGVRITVPRQRSAQPDQARLEQRFEEFSAAS